MPPLYFNQNQLKSLEDYVSLNQTVSVVRKNVVKKRWAAMGCVAGFLAAGSAQAFNQANQFVFGLDGGLGVFSPRHHLNNTGVIDARLGYNITKEYGVQALFSVFNTESTRGFRKGAHVNGNFYAFDVVKYFSPYHQFQPYIAAGPSVVALNPNSPDANNEGGINAALGSQWFSGKKIALSLEARAFYTMIGGKWDFYPNAGVVFLF